MDDIIQDEQVQYRHSSGTAQAENERDFNKEMRELRKESWDELIKESGGDYDKAMKILDRLQDKSEVEDKK